MTDDRPRIVLPESDDDLLDECDVSTFRSSGPGGQHVNKTESAVRMVHIPSGVVVQSQSDRSQLVNKLHCLTRLREKVEALNHREKPRKPTRPTGGSRRRGRIAKSKRSDLKKGRGQKDWSPDD